MQITVERVRRLIALAALCALAAVVGLALSGRPDPFQRLVGAVDAHASVAITTEDGATFVVPPNPDGAGAEIGARVLPEAERPAPPAAFPDYIAAWEFEVESGIDGATTLRAPVPEVDGAWTVVAWVDGEWQLIPFAVEGGTIVAPLVPIDIDFGRLGQWAGAVVGCVGDLGKCARDVKDALTDCISNVARCTAVVLTAPWELTNAFREAAIEGTRIAFGSDSIVYYVVKGSVGTFVEISDAAKEHFREAATSLFSFLLGQPTPIRCRPDDESIIFTPSDLSLVLDGCAQPTDDGSLLRVKNMRRVWVQVCPSAAGNVERRGAFDLFGPLSNCGGVEGGTLLAPSAEAAWDAGDNAQLNLNAYVTPRTFLLSLVDWLLSAVGVSDFGGKIGMALSVLESLRQIDEVQNVLQAVEQGRIPDAFRRFAALIRNELARGKVIEILARSGLAETLSVHLSADAIKAAIGWAALVEFSLDVANLATLKTGSHGYAGSVSFRSRIRTTPRAEQVRQADAEMQRVETTRQASDRTAVEPPTTQRAAPDHTLIREVGKIDVFLSRIANGKRFKRLLLNPTVFESYGFDWQSVRDVGADEIERWAHSSLVHLEGDTEVWQLFPDGDEGERRRLDLTDEQFISAGFDWDSVAPINRTEFGAYDEGRPVTAAELRLAGAAPTAGGSLRFVADVGDRTLTLRQPAGAAILPAAVGGRAPYSYRLSTPPGMRFDPATRQFGGTPVGLPANRALSYRVTDAAGNSAGLDFTISLVPADLAAPISRQSDGETAGRIVARRLADGRTEFGWQPTGGERILPSSRYFPAAPGHNRWLRSSPVEVGGVELGRINARQLSDGRIEFAFTPTGGERILPPQRNFPTSATVGRWLRSTEITFSPPAPRYIAVSSSGFHTCAIRANGEITCWGWNDYGQSDAPAGEYIAVSTGWNHSCAIRESDGAIACWGRNTQGQRDAPAGRFTAVSVGSWHTCGLRESGAIECWGNNEDGEASSPPGRFTAVSAGFRYTCAVRDDGASLCWGRNTVPKYNPATEKVESIYGGQTNAPAGSFTAISAGGDHACAIRTNGAIECWGRNEYGESIAPPGRYRAVSAGHEHTCAIRESDGAIECWGRDDDGQMNAAPAGSYSAISRRCGLHKSGEIECWGWQRRAGEVIPAGGYIAISGGHQHTCALRTNGEIACWGWTGTLPPPTGRFTTITSLCGLRESGAIECWGQNDYGQINAPSGSFRAISAGSWHTCAIRESGAIECWGQNDYGQINAPSGSFRAISAGSWHTCAIRESGAIECWGQNDYGQNGAPPGPFRAVSAGSIYTCGLRTSGTIECWGDGSWGRTSPPAGRFTAVSAGSHYACGLRESGEIECWGNNESGQTNVLQGRFTAVSTSAFYACGLRESGEIECWGDRSIILPTR